MTSPNSKPTLSSLATTGIKWSAGSRVGQQGLQFLTLIVLAKLLSPSDFGLLGMALVMTGFMELFKDLGTRAAIIQKRQHSEKTLSSIFWLNSGLGLGGALVIYFSSPLVAYFFHEPRVIPVLKVLSLYTLITSLSIVHQGILERDLRFGQLARIELLSVLLGSIAGISFAVLGYGVWSLVMQSLTTALATFVMLSFNSGWRPNAAFSKEEIVGIIPFSMNLTGFNLFNYLSRNADDILIGRYLGTQDLGYYNLAYRILLYPVRNISSVIERVMFPTYSRVQDDNAVIRRMYLKICGAIGLITFPMMMGLMAVASLFVNLFLDPKWAPIILLILIFAPVGMLQSIGTTVGSIYQAKGRTDWMFRWGVVSGTLRVLAFIIGLQWGLIGVAIAYATVTFLLTYHNYSIPFRLIDLSLLALGEKLWRPFLTSLLMVAAVIVSKWFLAGILSPVWLLASLIGLGASVYILLSCIINQAQAREVLQAI